MCRILSPLLIISTLLGPSYSCPTSLVEGTEFSITEWSCFNYSADFSWTLDLLVADTTIQLTCQNDTRDYSPDPLTTFRTTLSQSFSLPLTGAVECTISGCYEDRDTFTEYRIPPFIFSCLPPPPPPTNMDSSTVALPSPSPTNKLESGERDPLQSPAIDEGVPQVVFIVVPLGVSVILTSCLLVLFVLCVHEIYRYCTRNVLDLLQDKKLDESYSPIKLTNVSSHMLRSTETILEMPVIWHSALPASNESTPPPALATTGDEGDDISTSSSQPPFSSLGRETLAIDTAPTLSATVEDSPPGTSISHNTNEKDDEMSSKELANTLCRIGVETSIRDYTSDTTGTYVCESSLISSSGALSTSCGTTYLDGAHLSSVPHDSNTHSLQAWNQRESEKGNYVTEPLNSGCSSSHTMSDTLHYHPSHEQASDFISVQMESSRDDFVSVQMESPHELASDFVRVDMGPDEDPAAPQSAKENELLGQQCRDEDEVAMGFTERFTTESHCSLMSPNSSGTTSGLSTGSYLQWSTTEH